MKTAREHISELRLNKANVDHCVQYNTFNGTLLIDLENILNAYAEEVLQQSLNEPKQLLEKCMKTFSCHDKLDIILKNQIEAYLISIQPQL